ncbi:MAG: helix-turn-helix transcriptional regulator [Gammaproteobacteria bacterium]
MSISMMTPHEMTVLIAKRTQVKRLALNLSQQTLSERSGVRYGTLKKFERSGQISLQSLLKLALTLDALEEFKHLFTDKEQGALASLDKLIKDKVRKRGRK